MQQAQRAEDNHALEHAVQWANELGKPLLVGFGLTDDYPEANARHYQFMLQGLAEVETSLKRRGIGFVVRLGAPDEVALELTQDAACVVCDRGYLRDQKAWRERLAKEAPCRVDQVETDVIVPVEEVSDKAEYAARTLRPKIHRKLDTYLVSLRTTPLNVSADELELAKGVDLTDVGTVLGTLDLVRKVPPVSLYQGGTRQAKTILRTFLDEHFTHYADNRNQPHTDDVSYMSMYLHFGQISPLYIALQVQAAEANQENIDTYLEELIVRRELAMNFVHYTPDYDQYSCIPAWAQKTLAEHRDDKREHLYTTEQLVQAETHDPYWNAAMSEMRETGYMHNYMRMYWGKKILEWSKDPKEAFERTLKINNRYFIDGRDANSYTGVAWCYGVHDRAWTERAIFGKVRYMNARGLERKTKPALYVEKVKERVERRGG